MGMRDILFRGKRVIDGKWVESCCPLGEMHSGTVTYDFDSKTVCQYTGLTDRNGRKIFEGDIVRCGGILVVTWNEKFAGWCLTKEGWLYNHFFGEACEPGDCEVIGNIFDNPEMVGERIENG